MQYDISYLIQSLWITIFGRNLGIINDFETIGTLKDFTQYIKLKLNYI
jgi:hypothetical protein